MDVPRAERLVRPSWVNARTSLGLVLFATSVLLGQRLLDDAARTTLLWTAARDLPQGSVLSDDDIRLVEIGHGGESLEMYSDDSYELVGAILGRPVTQGELIADAWISAEVSSSAERSMTIPLTPEHAVGGELRPGDRVDVYATFSSGDVRARTSLIARDIEIIDLVRSAALTLDETALVGVTVGVSSEDAARLAFAIRTGEVDIVKVISSGAASTTSSVSEGDFP